MPSWPLSRRVWIVGAVLAFVASSAPGAPARTYREAPMLAERVRAGKLPPVEERLPDDPPEVEPVDSIGKYGGTWRRLAIWPTDTLMGSRLGYEPLVRWDRKGTTLVPGLAESWEIRDGGKTYIFRLRKGLKWSDGHPFTSADFTFWYEDVIRDKELTPIAPSWIAPGGGEFSLTAPDQWTVVFHFKEPNGIFLETLGFRGHWIYHPRHYLDQFHAKYADKQELEREAEVLGLDLWYRLFQRKADLHENTKLPTVRPWIVTVPPPDTRMVVERNPYYWKVDPAGNQLPYIDRITFPVVQNQEILNFKAMTGAVDMQARHIDMSKYTLFMESRKKGKYRVLADLSPGSTCIYVNQWSKDPELREILCDRRFRIALSAAVNRDELIEMIYSGLAGPTSAVSGPFDPYYLPEFEKHGLTYDPDLANRLLDEVGMKRGEDGMRRMPDGKPFKQILHSYPSEGGTGGETWQLIADYWREVGLDFVPKLDAATLSSMQVRNGNSDFWAYGNAGMHWIVDPIWYVPLAENAYHAPLFGRYYARKGRSGVPPTPEFQRLVDWYEELAATVGNDERKTQLGRNILSQWARECYIIGIAREKRLTIVSNRFKNMPDHMIQCYRLMAPGYIGPEQFYLDERE